MPKGPAFRYNGSVVVMHSWSLGGARMRVVPNTIKSVAALLAGCLLAGAAVAGAHEARIAAAIADPERSAEHRERDGRSKPADILPLLALEEGDTAVDIFGGSGYYADLIAGIVGPDGVVILQNNTPYGKWVNEANAERYGNNRRPPVTLLNSEVDDLQLGEDAIDAALMVMSYHDLYYTNPERGWYGTDVGLFLEQVRVALKPGARLVIVDHAAAAGTGSTAAQDLHRIDEAYVRGDIEGAGFRFVESSDVLGNPEDDLTRMVFAPGVRGQTDRFVLVFEKP